MPDARVQQHVVKPARAPILLIELFDGRGAPFVQGGQVRLGMLRLLRESAHIPLALGLGRGIDKNMKAAGIAHQCAGRSAAHQNAVARLRLQQNLLLNQLHHALGVEGAFLPGRRRIYRVLPQDFSIAVVPGIGALVVALGQLGVTPALRAAPHTRSESSSRQPRRWARSCANSPPCEPYSRSTVITRIGRCIMRRNPSAN